MNNNELPEGFEKIEQMTDHPLEDFFDIEKNSTMITTVQASTEMSVADHKEYDNKDKEIETQFDEVYKAALSTFHNTLDDAEDIEPKYRNKSREVAVQFLNTALLAADKKALLKSNKDKLTHKVTTNNSITQNNIKIDRNELVKMLRDQKAANVIDVVPSDDHKGNS